MILEYTLKNILYYFIPIAASSTIAIITSDKIRKKKKIVFWGNLLLFIFIIVFSFLTCPPEAPLQVELAFYALREIPGGSYELHSLLGDEKPSFLGLDPNLGRIQGTPVVHSGESSQMRLKLSRKGYVYAYHLCFNNDSPDQKPDIRQLFPSEKTHQINPILNGSWLELPSREDAWNFDKKPGLEIFLIYVSSKRSEAIKGKFEKLLEETKGFDNRAAMLENLQQHLKALAPCNPTTSSLLEHNLSGVTPGKVKTFTYQAQDDKSALLYQFVQHIN